jgi:hypothetical protein
MRPAEISSFLEMTYPLTIVADRYDGTYSGGRFLAFPLYYDDLPKGFDDTDVACARFWEKHEEPVGVGATANAAVADLIIKVKNLQNSLQQ